MKLPHLDAMEFEAAFSMADPLSSIPVGDFGAFPFGNDHLFAGLGFDFPASAAPTAGNHAPPAKSQPLPFSIFGGLMQSSSAVVANPQLDSPESVDSDEDYGDFESVPAEEFCAHTPANVESAKVEDNDFTLQRRKSYDLFDFLRPSSNVPSIAPDDLFGNLSATSEKPFVPAASHTSIISGDLLGNLSATTGDGLFPADKMAGAVGALNATTAESKSDGDDLFGNFYAAIAESRDPADELRSGAIPTSTAADDLFGNVSTTAGNPLSPSDKFAGASGKPNGTLLENNSDDDWGDFVEHSNSVTKEGLQSLDWFDTAVDVASPVTPKTNGGWMFKQSVNLTGYMGSELSPDVFSGFAPFPMFGEGIMGNTPERPQILNAQDLNNLANGSTAQPHVPVLQRSSSTIHSRKVSVVENSSTPIPLSLFGEEESENEKPKEEVVDMVSRPFQRHSRSKSLSSEPLPSHIGNFSDFISSLYVKSPLDTQASNGNLEGHEGSENSVAEKNTIRVSFDDTVDEDWLFSNASIKPHQTAESSNLEEQLFGLKVGVPNVKSNFGVADGGFCEMPTLLKEDSVLFGIELDLPYDRSKFDLPYDGSSLEEQFLGLKVDIVNAELDFGAADGDVCEMPTSLKEDSMHTGAWRITSGGAHSSVLDQLSLFQEMDASELEMPTSIEREMKVKSDVTAAVNLHSQEVTTFPAWACPSVEGQCLFVKAWADVLTVCASELEQALDVWGQAQLADVHLALLANLQGKQYFAAVGQIYAVSLIFESTLTLYRPWLAIAVKEGQNAQASLERCKTAWVGTGLEEAVCLALCELGSLLPSSVLSWKDIEGCATIAHCAAMQAGSLVTNHEPFPPLCGLSLVPLPLFSCLRSVEWAGCHYLLPVANIWANCVSNEAPKLPSIVLGKIGMP